MFSYWLNYHWSGQDPYSYHLLNLVFHFVNAILVYFVVRRLLAREQAGSWRVEVISVFAGALFLLHPIQTESAAYIAGRSEVLSAFFFLCAFTVFLYRPSPAIGWRTSMLVLALFACALASKEHTITLPFLFLLTDAFWAQGDWLSAVRRNWRLYLPLICGGSVAALAILFYVNRSTSAGYSGTGVGWAIYFLTECRVFFVYVGLLLFPVGQNVDHDISWFQGFDWITGASLLGIAAICLAAWRLRKEFPLASYGVLILGLLLAPTSSFIPIKDPMAEHRLYLPILGFVLIACECLLRLERRKTIGIASALVIVLSIATYDRCSVWAKESALWEDTVAKSPNKVRDYAHLVHGLVREHRCKEALDRLNEVSRRLKPDAALLSHWSFAYECAGEPEQALEKLQQSAALLPWPSTYLNMARHQLTLNRLQDSIQSVTQALKLNPQLEPAYLLRAGIFAREGDLLAAARDYQQALKLNPQDQRAYTSLLQINVIRQSFSNVAPALQHP